MTDPFIGETRIFGFDFAPKYWAYCDGAILQIAQNQALFSLLGTTYGGNGVSTFGLPDLRGRAAAGYGPSVPLGLSGGRPTQLLSDAEMPAPHGHLAMANLSGATANLPNGNVLARTSGNVYAVPTKPTGISSGSIAPTGGNAHENMSPYQVVNLCIALYGIYPPRP